MRWFHKTLLGAVAASLGGVAAGQEPQARPSAVAQAVSLGQPTPIAPAKTPSESGVVRAFVPIGPASPGIQRATYRQDRPQTVVRGAMPSIGDDPKSLYPPRELSPFGDASLPPPTFPLSPLVGEAKPARDDAHVIDIDKDGRVAVVPDPPKLIPVSAVVSESVIVLHDGGSIFDGGSSLFNGGLGGDQRFYAEGEWLLWWTRGFHLPPLVLTDSASTPLATRGQLGNGTAQLLYGDSNTSSGPNAGARFNLGYALDPCGLCAIEGNFFFLSPKNSSASFFSSQYPVIGRPFFDLNDGVPSRELTTSPPGSGIFASVGSIRVDTSSTLLGAELNLRSLLCCGCDYKITGLVGFRYLNLSESVRIDETSNLLTSIPFTAPDVPVNAGDQVRIFDQFSTRNQFYGGQFGASAEWQRGPWTLEGNFKIGLGVTQQFVDINGGQQIVSPNGRTQNFVGGLYALPSNIGGHSQNRFGFVPEIGFKLGYNITDNIRLFVGYDFLYWSSVLRPGDQIDQVLDLNQVPQSGRPYPTAPQVRPVVPFATSSYWAQGINAGIEFRY